MKVFAIDPGTTQSAWVLWDMGAEEVVNKGIHRNEDMPAIIRMNAKDAALFAVEMIASYGMPVGREVFETCVWIGRFIHAFAPGVMDHSRFQVYRLEVKSHLCHSAKAKDANVRQALIDRFGAPGTKKEPGKLYGVSKDIWSAVAVAVTFADKLRRKAA